MATTPEEEAAVATRMLRTKVVSRVERFQPREVLVEFTDGIRLFVEATADGDLELSITADFVPDDVQT
jgi:hypothetical protein